MEDFQLNAHDRWASDRKSDWPYEYVTLKKPMFVRGKHVNQRTADSSTLLESGATLKIVSVSRIGFVGLTHEFDASAHSTRVRFDEFPDWFTNPRAEP